MKDLCWIRATRDYAPGEQAYYAVGDEEPVIHKGDVGQVVTRLSKEKEMYCVEFSEIDEDIMREKYSVLIDMHISEMDFILPEDKDEEWPEGW